MDVPASQTDWIPPAGIRNRRHETECLNAAITAINRGAGVITVNIHLEGIRVEKGTGKVLHKHKTGKQVWREAEVRRRLHLTPEYKVKDMGGIAKLFRVGLKPTKIRFIFLIIFQSIYQFVLFTFNRTS